MAVGAIETEADLSAFVRREVDRSSKPSAVAPGFMVFPAVDAADVPILGVFCDKADGKLKFKDAGGTVNALY